MTAYVETLIGKHGALLCAVTVCALLLFAGGVFSKPTPSEAEVAKVVDPFALKNANAFDPARRRTVRAMKDPGLSAPLMASGLDHADADTEASVDTAADTQPADEAAPRLAANAD